jgi:glycosyltransferase involved in cell wall biosynthesis
MSGGPIADHGERPDIIFVSMEDWDEVWRRNQFLCAGFARRYPNQKILFVGVQRDVSCHLKRGSLAALRARGEWTVPEFPNIRVLHPLKLLPNSITACRNVNDTFIRRQVRAAARRHGIGPRPILWLNPHYALHMAGRFDEAAVIYDITDDWTELSQSPALTRLIRRQDAALCRRADAVIVCSEKLHELKAQYAPRLLSLIPNGVDADHYASVLESGSTAHPASAGWTRPVLGYTGTLHPDRIDVALVQNLAAAFPSGTVALVGPDYLPDEDRKRLDLCGNVVRTGAVPYRDLPAYMRSFDVCVTPHRMTPFTESLNPIKLWEYLAAGKPIVATDVAGFRDHPRLVRIARDGAGFVAAVREALAGEAPGLAEQRREFAAGQSWESRLDAVEQVIDVCIRGESETPETPGADVRRKARRWASTW